MSGSRTIHRISMIASVMMNMFPKDLASLFRTTYLLWLVTSFFPYWIRDVVTSSL